MLGSLCTALQQHVQSACHSKSDLYCRRILVLVGAFSQFSLLLPLLLFSSVCGNRPALASVSSMTKSRKDRQIMESSTAVFIAMPLGSNIALLAMRSRNVEAMLELHQCAPSYVSQCSIEHSCWNRFCVNIKRKYLCLALPLL